MTEKWMTVKDISEYLQLSKDQIYRLAQQGKIPAAKIGRGWRFRKEKIDEWMELQSLPIVRTSDGEKYPETPSWRLILPG